MVGKVVQELVLAAVAHGAETADEDGAEGGRRLFCLLIALHLIRKCTFKPSTK